MRLFIYLLLLPVAGFAQDPSVIEQCEYMLKGDFRRYENPLKVTQDILKEAEKIATAQGIEYQIEMLKNTSGDISEYPVLRILTTGQSVANQEAALVARDYGGLPLYFSPYDLKRSGANAFFDSDGSKLGVPFDFLLNQKSESYLHEKIHADAYRKLISKEDDTYAGLFKLLKGERMSSRNGEAYFRRAAIDEMKATKFSAEESMRSLYQRFKTTPRSEFLRDEANEELLSSIYSSLQTEVNLAEQVEDLLSEAKVKLSRGEFSSASARVSLGSKLSASVTKIEILVPSFERVFQGGRGIEQKIENGTAVILYANESSQSRLNSRLNFLIQESVQSQQSASKSLSLIGTRIDLADLPTTDIERLYQSFNFN